MRKSRKSEIVPPPGSDAALVKGCSCPVMDNHYGDGLYTTKEGNKVFVINSECKLHALKKGKENETKEKRNN